MRSEIRSRPDRSAVARGSSTAAAVLLTGLAGFEALLAAGVPWGRAAWGGGSAELNPGLRVGSAAVAVVFLGAALVVRRVGGHRNWAPLPDRWSRPAVWGLAAYTGLGTILNMLSRSPVERAVMTPVALSLAVLCGLTAAWGSTFSVTDQDATEGQRPDPAPQLGTPGPTAS
jgi:hypothetical protein